MTYGVVSPRETPAKTQCQIAGSSRRIVFERGSETLRRIDAVDVVRETKFQCSTISYTSWSPAPFATRG